MSEEYLILEVTNDLVFNKLIQEMNTGNIQSISIPRNLNEKDQKLNVEMGDFRFQGDFVDTIGSQLILDESNTPIGSTEKILLLDPICKS